MGDVTKAGEIIGDALSRQQKQQDEARKTAEEIDAQRERERAGGVASLLPAVAPTPPESES